MVEEGVNKKEEMDNATMLQTGYLMAHFIRYSFRSHHSTDKDRKLSQFLVTNLAKGALITNTILLVVYAARHRTYRNSSLVWMHVPATLLGLLSGINGTAPVFYAYLFNTCELN